MASNLFHQLNPQSNGAFQSGNVPFNAPQANNPMGNINPQIVQSVKRMMNMLKGVQNPQQALTMATKQNPQLAAVMNMISGSGMSPQQLFYQIAQQNGVDPQSIINMLNQP